jgi:hypothetical protein
MIFHLFNPHRLKCSQANVQRYINDFNAPQTHSLQNLGRKMQPGRRGRHRSALPRIYGLIPITIRRLVFARDVGRQGHVAELLYGSEKILSRRKPNLPLSKGRSTDHLSPQLVAIAEEKLFADPYLPARTNEALPFIRSLTYLLRQKNFDAPAQELARCGVPRADRLRFGPTSASIKASRKHAGIVEHDQVIGLQEIGKIPKNSVFQSPALPVQVQHAGSGPVGQRFLRNLCFGKIVVKVGNEHAEL